TDRPRLIHRDDDLNHWVTGVAEDDRHRLWISVLGVGVMRYDRHDGGKVERVPADDRWYTATHLRGLCIDAAGPGWVAAGDGGLGGMRADGTFDKVPIDLLPGDFVAGVWTDRAGRLRAETDGG